MNAEKLRSSEIDTALEWKSLPGLSNISKSSEMDGDEAENFQLNTILFIFTLFPPL